MRSLPMMLALALLALPLHATPPMPLISAHLEWRAPETLVIVIDSQVERQEATLEVETGADRRLVSTQAISTRTGTIEFFATVHVDEPMQPVRVRVIVNGSVFAFTEAYLTTTEKGETRFMTPQEVEAAMQARVADARKRAEDARVVQMRARVRRLVNEGRKPACSAEAAPLWNRAVREELGAEAPASCRD